MDWSFSHTFMTHKKKSNSDIHSFTSVRDITQILNEMNLVNETTKFQKSGRPTSQIPLNHDTQKQKISLMQNNNSVYGVKAAISSSFPNLHKVSPLLSKSLIHPPARVMESYQEFVVPFGCPCYMMDVNGSIMYGMWDSSSRFVPIDPSSIGLPISSTMLAHACIDHSNWETPKEECREEPKKKPHQLNPEAAEYIPQQMRGIPQECNDYGFISGVHEAYPYNTPNWLYYSSNTSPSNMMNDLFVNVPPNTDFSEDLESSDVPSSPEPLSNVSVALEQHSCSPPIEVTTSEETSNVQTGCEISEDINVEELSSETDDEEEEESESEGESVEEDSGEESDIEDDKNEDEDFEDDESDDGICFEVDEDGTSVKEKNEREEDSTSYKPFSFVVSRASDTEETSQDEYEDYDCDLFDVGLEDQWNLPGGSALDISNLLPQCYNQDTVDYAPHDCYDDELTPEERERRRQELIRVNELWVEEIELDVQGSSTPTKVQFNEYVEVGYVENYYRRGPWEKLAQRRCEYEMIYEICEEVIPLIMTPEHRLAVRQRFYPYSDE